MKDFLQIYLGLFIALPLAFCAAIYLAACFITWSILPVNIEWGVIRAYIILGMGFAFLLRRDK